MISLDHIREARARVAGRVHTTPLVTATQLAQPLGVALHLKCENLQKTGSFKPRGALNKLLLLEPSARRRGVVTFSAGNHAQALAWAAAAVDVRCTVVMPASASASKAAASAGYGAEVILHGSALDALQEAQRLAEERDLTFVHPFDDEHIVAGAGTLGLELLEQLPQADVVVVPIGGGGLIAGVAAAIKLGKPAARVYGVEPTGAAAMRRSLDAGRALRLDSVRTVADGLAAPMAGEIPFALVRQYVDDVVTLVDEDIVDAMRALLSRAKLLAEPAGAAALAAVLRRTVPLDEGMNVVAIVSGGNVDLSRLKELL